MTLMLRSLGAYACYSRNDTAWRTEDYDLHGIVKALKREHFNGYVYLPSKPTVWHKFTAENPDAALEIFGEWGSDQLVELELDRPVALVPVPNSRCVEFGADCAALRMANAIQKRMAAGAVVVESCFRFREVLPPRHMGGGSRSPAVIRSNLVLKDAVRARRAVLIDDVKTQGHSLRIAAEMLRARGVSVENALVAGTSHWAQVPEAFGLAPEDLEAAVQQFDWDQDV